eukprot:4762229-Alexandrium_andersonii.AAC.1
METYFTALGLTPTQTFNAQGNIFDRTALAIRLRPLLDAWLQGGWPDHRYPSPARLMAQFARLRGEVAALGVEHVQFPFPE